MPRYLYRITTSESAGSIIKDNDGLTRFRSHAMTHFGNEVPSDFSAFTMQDVESNLRCHVRGWKKPQGKPFYSHFISTSDSLVASLSRAKRRENDEDDRNKGVTVHIIDTYNIRAPTLPLSMYSGTRAYSCKNMMAPWRWRLYRPGSRVEWMR